MSSQSDPVDRTSPWLVWPAGLVASTGVLMGLWQVASFGLGIVAGDYVGELEGIVRVSAAAGAIAMLATVPVARFLFRRARASAWLAVLMIPVGVVAIYELVPRVFLYAKF